MQPDGTEIVQVVAQLVDGPMDGAIRVSMMVIQNGLPCRMSQWFRTDAGAAHRYVYSVESGKWHYDEGVRVDTD